MPHEAGHPVDDVVRWSESHATLGFVMPARGVSFIALVLKPAQDTAQAHLHVKQLRLNELARREQRTHLLRLPIYNAADGTIPATST